MSDIKGKYKKILDDLENNIKNPEDLIYTKEKFMELTLIFKDIIDRLTALTDARIKEIEERQEEINSRISSVQSMVDEIEGDIYEEDDGYEFEIVCPYCNYEFTTDMADEERDEIKCPNCNNIIELDWNQEDDCSACAGNCSHCYEDEVAEESSEYKTSGKEEKQEKQEYQRLLVQINRDNEYLSTKKKENDLQFANWNRSAYEYDKDSSDLVLKDNLNTGFNVAKRVSNIVNSNTIKSNKIYV